MHVAVFVTPKVAATRAYRSALLEWVEQKRTSGGTSSPQADRIDTGGVPEAKPDQGKPPKPVPSKQAETKKMHVEPWAEFVFEKGSIVATNVKRNAGYPPKQSKLTESTMSSRLHPRSAKSALADRIAARQAGKEGLRPTSAVPHNPPAQLPGDEQDGRKDKKPTLPGMCPTDAGSFMTLVAWGHGEVEDALEGVRVQAFGLCGPASFGSSS